MKCLLILVPLLVASQSVAQTYTASASSSIKIEMQPDGWTSLQRAVRFDAYRAIPDDIKVGTPFPPRLATITTVTEGVVDSPRSHVEVAVDDMSGAKLRRIVTFTDDGDTGTVVGGKFFATAAQGPGWFIRQVSVRNLETGKLLFRASGTGEVGMVAWVSAPNLHPAIERWAAFETAYGSKDPALLGVVRYGDRDRAFSAVELRMEPSKQPEEFIIDLPECGALMWREVGKALLPGQGARPAKGACQHRGGYFPVGHAALAQAVGAKGGVEIELSVRGEVYATVPVRDDRLDVAHATLAPGVMLKSVAEGVGFEPTGPLRAR